uniref:Cilia and flagella associated protein 68 n=1 Tax=Astyanax mexicanus TaxID=7994 RepID=A0A3B1JD03_ASTMX
RKGGSLRVFSARLLVLVLACLLANLPPFHYCLRASGQAEVWRDYTDEAKFKQYGWRSSTAEDAYSVSTLIGNWSERRADTRRAKELRRPLPSQVSTALYTQKTTFNCTYVIWNRRELVTLKREPRIFPGHQPELDPPHTKCVLDSCYRLDFSRHGSTRSSARPSAPDNSFLCRTLALVAHA